MSEGTLPIVNALNRPFWDAAERGELVLPHCIDSVAAFWPPSAISPLTGGPVAWRSASPLGTVGSVVTYRRAFQQAFAHLLPYAIALIELDCGPRLFAHVADPDGPNAPVAGGRAEIRFQSILADGPKLPIAVPYSSMES